MSIPSSAREVLYLAISAMSGLGAGRGAPRSGLLRLELSLDSDNFGLDRIKPLQKVALVDNLDDAPIWDRIRPPTCNLLHPANPMAVQY
ncbi:hypothetical protein DL766_000124 [Monosporascus sp. MC13-8B]|uniref:Uncharacterized protein n=1 Tax=Monosporascus cannonballus TaxID=155416 RepID=A0ABY0H1F9_9PEZI|nr:hypothetical protein DL762_008195 [Monosporascus cannonballus]RYP40100.1 hypothetical protein DL766_000124 [Monosporascus sp. MC13-8B]